MPKFDTHSVEFYEFSSHGKIFSVKLNMKKWANLNYKILLQGSENSILKKTLVMKNEDET